MPKSRSHKEDSHRGESHGKSKVEKVMHELIGRLRKMAEEGRLTADVVVNALMSQKDKLATEYAQLPATVSQSFQRLQNAFGEWVSQVDQSTGITKKLAEALTWLSQNLDP